MARSPLTLAAAATAALPRARVVAAGGLTAGGDGRCDAAVLTLDDGRRLVARAPADPSIAQELAAEALALRALTPGVRELLGVRAPELLGEAALPDARVLITDLLPGYQIDAVHLPAGPGAATSVGRALAAVHALPASVVRSEGLAARSAGEVRDLTVSLVDQAAESGRVPVPLLTRWRAALDADDLWRFEPTVILGSATATSFLFEDSAEGPSVTGILDWHGLRVDDPAIDLGWLASAQAAADDVIAAYQAASHRAPDAHLHTRALLYAELEFARWLVHGVRLHRTDIVDDAAGMLDVLAENVEGTTLLPDADSEPLEAAMGLLGRVPTAAATVDTSMQTDAYDAEELSMFIDAEQDAGPDGSPDAAPDGSLDAGPDAAPAPGGTSFDDVSTAPIDLVAWADAHAEPGARALDLGGSNTEPGSDADADAQAQDDAARASRDALRRWAASE